MVIFSQEWLLASVVVAFGALLQGAGGIGFGMVAAPVMAMIWPDSVPGPMLLLGLLVALFSAVRERSAIDRVGLVYALAGRLPTSVAAALLIGILPLKALSVVFALIILTGVGLSVSGIHFPPSRVNLFIAGLVSGFMGTITSVGVPPIALIYQHAAVAQLRATIGGYLVIGTLISIAALVSVGRFGLHDILLGTWLVLPLAIGLALSNRLTALLPRCHVRSIVLALSAGAAMILLVRQFV